VGVGVGWGGVEIVVAVQVGLVGFQADLGTEL